LSTSRRDGRKQICSAARRRRENEGVGITDVTRFRVSGFFMSKWRSGSVGFVAAVVSLSAHLTAQQPVPRAASSLRPEDLFQLSVASDAQIAPDGGIVAYVRTSNDVMVDRARTSIWFVDTRTRIQTRLPGLPLTADLSQPRWSPTGDRVAFVGRPEGGGAGIYVYTTSTGSTTLIATPARGPGQLTWSPDGRTIAFVMSAPQAAETLGRALEKPAGAVWAEPLRITSRIEFKKDGEGERKPGYSHVFTVSADSVSAGSGTPRQLTSGSFEDAGPLSWTRDGHALLFTSRRGPDWERERDLYAIYSVSIADGVLRQLTANKGPETSASVSPDGRHVAFTGYVQNYRGYENRRLFLMDTDGSNRRELGGPPDRSVDKGKPQWSADGLSLYVGYEDRGAAKVACVGLDGHLNTIVSALGGDEGIADTPYAGGTFSVAQDGTVAFAQGAPDHPSDVAIVRRGAITRLTNLNERVLLQRTVGAIQSLAVTSKSDGAAVDAWLVLPPNFDPSRRYPLILEMHGGPFAAYGPLFATDHQLFAAAGYIVLYANPRGSTGYGDAFANAINHSYPGVDYDDLMSAVDAAVAKGFANPDRLFVAGMSGGGALTTWIVGKTSRFKAAVAEAPPVDWTSETLTVDFYPWMSRQWFGTMPWENHELLWQHSPLSLVGNVTTPTMLVVGDADMRTPPSQAEEYYAALQIRGIPTTLIKIPGASHTTFSARPSQNAARINAILAWFARYDAALPTP
jgi:dipeptidyl aminopeptidase/acylaminoacyl peptidase